MRVAWSDRDAGKYPLAGSRNGPAAPRLTGWQVAAPVWVSVSPICSKKGQTGVCPACIMRLG